MLNDHNIFNYYYYLNNNTQLNFHSVCGEVGFKIFLGVKWPKVCDERISRSVLARFLDFNRIISIQIFLSLIHYGKL